MFADTLFEVDPQRRFGGIARLYGDDALARLAAAHVCVIGVGGVGSWSAEALARSGVGRISLIDLDHVAESNINRQAHALEHTLGQAKVLAMAERIHAINPQAAVHGVEEFVTAENAAALLRGYDYVIDAIDNVRAKAAIALACRDARMPLTMAGGAGGKTDPCAIRVDDLARSTQDPLLAKVRSRLRKEHGYPRDPRRRFGIEVVYVDQPLRRPAQACGSGRGPQGLACAGYGSSMMMTASVGLAAAARALERLLAAQVQGGSES
ncbi:tRNA threonylcarbamoyladenosine dehydratase [Pseudothauera rhizosphaerae]|uniref:tRNA threonylcarbamoyladenosine dehydratase n=1 Tax=Pseudothauera rhizosphaerae TaxID=2565932 RepID=A0A4S4ANS5_9RHOO|nr:tRNA threonylcarbamoyladenosine dehydratase [Pseudothauera rhizosphaerae]THF61304.1 tRNA threonylcarbamoyladenosine dehydratase [Pseudothauera rhizosphaerae]